MCSLATTGTPAHPRRGGDAERLEVGRRDEDVGPAVHRPDLVSHRRPTRRRHRPARGDGCSARGRGSLGSLANDIQADADRRWGPGQQARHHPQQVHGALARRQAYDGHEAHVVGIALLRVDDPVRLVDAVRQHEHVDDQGRRSARSAQPRRRSPRRTPRVPAAPVPDPVEGSEDRRDVAPHECVVITVGRPAAWAVGGGVRQREAMPPWKWATSTCSPAARRRSSGSSSG